MLLRVVLGKDQLSGFVLDLLFEQVGHSSAFNNFLVQLLLGSDLLFTLRVVGLENETAPCHVDVRIGVDLPALLFGQFELDDTEWLALSSLRDVNQNRP